MFPFLPGNAEAQVIWGGIVKCLLIAYIVGNISAKKYKNPFTCINVIASQRWDVFWDTVYNHCGVMAAWSHKTLRKNHFFAFLWEKFQNAVLKGFIATPIDVLCSNFVKFGRQEIGMVVRYLPDKKNKISPSSPALATGGSRPKSARASPRQCTQSAPAFIQIGSLYIRAPEHRQSALECESNIRLKHSFEPNKHYSWCCRLCTCHNLLLIYCNAVRRGLYIGRNSIDLAAQKWMLLLTSHVFCITINVYVWYRVRDTTFTSVTGWPDDALTRHVIVCLLWSPYEIRQTIIFLPCGYFFLLFFPRRTSAVADWMSATSTHDVALVQISDAGPKPAARGSLKTQDAKKSPKIAIRAPSHNFVGLYLHN